MHYKFMAKLQKIQNRAIKIISYGLRGMWLLLVLLMAYDDHKDGVFIVTDIPSFFMLFFVPFIVLSVLFMIIDGFLGKVTKRADVVSNWAIHMHLTGFYITFEKQPILLNIILGGLFGGIFTGAFAFAFTERILVVAVIVTCAVCLVAIFGRRTAKHMNSNPDQYKPLLEKTNWGYIQRDALSARIWSKKPK